MEKISYYFNEKLLINKNKHVKKSFGIICVSRDGYMIVNQAPPYKTLEIILNKFEKDYFGILQSNTNEKFNFELGMFPNAVIEGEYTFPKGKKENIDKNKMFTKIREFIEETKCYHPVFEYVLYKHTNNVKYESFLNDKNLTVNEKWIGLNNKIYHCEYSIFVVNSLNEMIQFPDKVIPLQFILNLPGFSLNNVNNQNGFYNKYRKSSILDSFNKIKIVTISEGIQLLNSNKLKIINKINENDILKAIKKYKYDNNLKLNGYYKNRHSRRN